jgi:RNA 3'-terminal phosphate cyclase
MHDQPRAIDGSYGEGGGQLLRTAVALGALTATQVRKHSIRAGGLRLDVGTAGSTMQSDRRRRRCWAWRLRTRVWTTCLRATRELTPHARTAIWLVGQFLSTRFSGSEVAGGARVTVVPEGRS